MKAKIASFIGTMCLLMTAQGANATIYGLSDASYTDIWDQCVQFYNATASNNYVVDLATTTYIGVNATWNLPNVSYEPEEWGDTIFSPDSYIIWYDAEYCQGGWGLYSAWGYHRWKDVFGTWHYLSATYDITFAWSPL